MAEIELLTQIYNLLNDGLQVQIVISSFIAGLMFAFYVHLKGLF